MFSAGANPRGASAPPRVRSICVSRSGVQDLFAEREDHEEVARGGSFQLGVQLIEVALAGRAATDGHGDILFPIHRIADGIAGHRAAHRHEY